MIQIGPEAQAYFRRLVEQQGEDTLGVRLAVAHAGTPKADCRLEFCEASDLAGDEWVVECEGFRVYLDAPSAPFLDDAEIDLVREGAGSQLQIRAPSIKGRAPGADASLIERVRYLLESEVNPALASHGGRVALESIDAEGGVWLRFGGGCHGCGMVDATLRGGIEKTLRTQFPEITSVNDATDHASGANPYVRR